MTEFRRVSLDEVESSHDAPHSPHGEWDHLGADDAPVASLRGDFGARQLDPTHTAINKTKFGLIHLVCLAGLLHLGIHFSGWQFAFSGGMLICSTAIFLMMMADGSARFTLRNVVSVLLPCAVLPPKSADGNRYWLPVWGWRDACKGLEQDLERAFSGPMIAMALLVLPLLAAEIWLADGIESSVFLTWLVAAANAVVWGAFALEFAYRCNVSLSKWDYFKRHWLDAIVIAMPLVAFLRLARLGQLSKLQRSARMFRLKGVAMRGWRSVVLLNLLGRFLDREADSRAIRLRRTRDDLQSQLDRIDHELALLDTAQQEVRRAA